MGEELGVDIELTKAPLKYPGLTPWEIWLSEAQERMVVAVPPAKLDRLQALADLWDVEVSVLGTFTGDDDLRVRYNDRIVADLPMSFVHDGLPRRHMTAVWVEQDRHERPLTHSPTPPISTTLLLALLSTPTVASKEQIVRTYDHEVRGGTLVRPFIGPEMDGPSDAAVLKPLGTWEHDKAFSLSATASIPLLGQRDPYAMAVSAIDEAVRNAVAVGADPDRIAILDNFCWGNPTYPDRLGALVRTCQGCYDAAVAYRHALHLRQGQPLQRVQRPADSGHAAHLGHRHRAGHAALRHLGLQAGGQSALSAGRNQGRTGRLAALRAAGQSGRHGADHARRAAGPLSGAAPRPCSQGLVRACHDLSEGGLAVALAEMCLAGRLGARCHVAGERPVVNRVPLQRK